MIETIFVIGPAGAGKSAFAAELSAALFRKLSFWAIADTSAVLITRLAEIQAAGPWEWMQPAGAHSVAKWEEYIRANKNRFRPALVKLAQQARADGGPQRLTRLAMEKAGGPRVKRIVTGLRKLAELLQPATGPIGALFPDTTLIEVTRKDWPKVEDGYEAAAFAPYVQHRVVNDGGTSGSLKWQAESLAAELTKS